MKSSIKGIVTLLVTIAVLSVTSWPISDATGQGSHQKKWNRRIAKSPAAEAVPMFVYLLDRYARNASDKTEFDRAVEKAMARGKHSREIAAKLVKNFNAIPLGQRQTAFGRFADPTKQTILPQQIKDTIMNSLRAARPDRVTKQPAIPDPLLRKTEKNSRSERAEPPPSPDEAVMDYLNVPRTKLSPRLHHSGLVTPAAVSVSPRPDEPLQIRFEGLYCREEAFSDQGSNSDEIYLITEAIDVARAEAEATPMLHPRGSHHYEDVDTREIREGPVVSVYTGPPKDLTLIVTVMEFDFGDPNAFRDEVRVVVDVALAAIGAAVGSVGGVGGAIIGAAIGAGIGELIVDLINGILDTGDDLIEVDNIFLSAGDLANMYRQPLRDRRGDRDDGRGRTTIQYHFHTRHNQNEDADYYALFRVHDPNLHATVAPLSAELPPPDLVVTRVEITGTAAVTSGHIEVPFLVEVRNQGASVASIFKVGVDYGNSAGVFNNIPFTVPGERDTTFPFTRATLNPGRSTVFAGRLRLPLSERGRTVSLRAFADSCGGDEFLPRHCRVLESNEENNLSRVISVSLPR